HRHIPYNQSDWSTTGLRSAGAFRVRSVDTADCLAADFLWDPPPRVTFSTMLEQSMIRKWKCLLGAWAVCAILCRAGYSQVIEMDALGTARVLPPANVPRPADTLYSPSEPVWLQDFQPPPGVGVDPVTVPNDGSVGYAVTGDVAQILYRIGRV